MQRLARITVVAVLFIGRNSSSQQKPPAGSQSDRHAVADEQRPVSSTTVIKGYTIVFEYIEGTNTSIQGGRQDDGKGKVAEGITVTCGQQTLHILNGNLTLNGTSRGSIKRGDTNKLDADGKDCVNEQLRGG